MTTTRKTSRLNVANYRAEQRAPVFLSGMPVATKIKRPLRATLLMAVAGFALAFSAGLIIFTII